MCLIVSLLLRIKWSSIAEEYLTGVCLELPWSLSTDNINRGLLSLREMSLNRWDTSVHGKVDQV